MQIHYYETRSGRRPAKDFIDELPTRQRAQVLADLEAVERYGLLVPVSKRAIRGRDNKGIYEFRIGPAPHLLHDAGCRDDALAGWIEER